MGKKRGPCSHCGIESTPLWRNGPPSMPVLCNACGSRWRIRGTLENYTPKHAVKISHATAIKSELLSDVERQINDTVTRKTRVVKSKSHQITEVKTEVVANDEHSSSEREKISEPALLIPKLESTEVTIHDIVPDTTAGVLPGTLWETQIPSKKRSRSTRYGLSIVERLHKNLLMLLRQKRRSAGLSETEGNLIYYKDDQDTEVGMGCFRLEDFISSKRKKP